MGQVVDGAASPESAAHFAVRVDQPGDVVIVSAEGAVDLQTAPQLAEAVAQAQQQSNSLVLDLEGVDFLSSAGLSVLVTASQHAQVQGGRLAIVTSNRTVLRAIEVTGLDSVLSIFDTSGAATDFILQG